MKTLEDKVTQLCEIITSTDKKTSTKKGEFDGYSQYEEIEETYLRTARGAAIREIPNYFG